jgi:hypothetical protein
MNNIAKAASSRHRKLRPELRHDIDLFDFAREREGLQTKAVRHIARFRDRRAAEWGRAMTTNKKPGPRANAGNRANPKVGQGHIRASAVDWEADPAAIWFARWFALPTVLARLLAALASLGRALQ